MKLIILFLLFSFASMAQVSTKEPELILADPQEMPEFKGGMKALMTYLQDSVTAKISFSEQEAAVVKRAYAKFTITETGKVSDVSILRSCNVPRIDSLFKRALEKMPDWKPGAVEGKPTPMRMNLPMRFEPK